MKRTFVAVLLVSCSFWTLMASANDPDTVHHTEYVPAVLKDGEYRNKEGLVTHFKSCSKSSDQDTVRTSAAHPAEITHPILCLSQLNPLAQKAVSSADSVLSATRHLDMF